MDEQFSQTMNLIHMEFEHERQLMSDCHRQEIERLRDIMFAMDQNHLDREADAKQEFQSTRDEIKNKVIYSIDPRHKD